MGNSLRDLIQAFQAENDNIRYNQSIVYYQAGWSNYYPPTIIVYVQMPFGNSSIIRLRLADIMLLKAEALAWKGGASNLSAAADIVTK
jgi:hypothetical protein